jgi:hypothetical protein
MSMSVQPMSPTAALLPSVGAHVDMVVGGKSVAARWHAGSGSDIELLVRDDGVVPGERVMLRWHSLRGVNSTAADVLSVEASGGGRTFFVVLLRLTGQVEVVQRRRATRALSAGPVAVTPTDRALAPVRNGALLDIAEEGLRCRVMGGGLTEGQAVTVHVGLGEEVLELRGTVLRATGYADGVTEVVIVYAADEADGARIRRFVYLQQVRLRRAGLL